MAQMTQARKVWGGISWTVGKMGEGKKRVFLIFTFRKTRFLGVMGVPYGLLKLRRGQQEVRLCRFYRVMWQEIQRPDQ
jgi:hypothetical protein